MADKFQVDLKWSLWSVDRGVWEHYAPEAYKALTERTNDMQSVIINTACRKEIRAGHANVYRTKDGVWNAYGSFTAEWDSARELMDTLGLDSDNDDAYDAFVESIPFTVDGEPGITREFDVEAMTFEILMILIDEEEALLIHESGQAFKEVEEMYSKEAHGS